MSLPHNLKLYSGTVTNHDGSVIVSLRFAMSPTEFEFAVANDLLPDDTAEIEMMGQVPSLHDFHASPQVMQ